MGYYMYICTIELQVCMNVTIDTSALVAVIGNEASKPQIIDLTAGASLVAPMSVHWEIGNAFSAMFKRRARSLALAQQAIAVYREIPIKFLDVPLGAALDISYSQKIYAYDAYLIQCAQLSNSPLLTLDKGLGQVAKAVGVSLLEV